MKQICDGYNPKVLMSNWYQQSFSVPQPARDNPTKIPRNKQVDLGFIDTKGKLKALNTVSRLQPWNTDNLVSAPQYKSNKCNNPTQMKQNYDLKTISNFHRNWKPLPITKGRGCNTNNKTYVQIDKFNPNHKLFNQRNINQLLNERSTDQNSFKSGLKPNHHIDRKQHLQTIYQMQLSHPAKLLMNNEKFQQKQLNDRQIQQTINSSSCNNTQESANKQFRRIRSQITLKTTVNFPFTNK